VREAIGATVMITVFVAAAMLLVEYLHILRAVQWQSTRSGSRIAEHLLAALLGTSPGCLGMFAAVTLYTHGSLGFAALVTAAIASCGDEAFVMLAMFPREAVLIFLLLGGWGLLVGGLLAVLTRRSPDGARQQCLQVHAADVNLLPPWRTLRAQWHDCSPTRGSFALLFGGSLAALLSGAIAGDASAWIRWTFALCTGFALFVVATAPEHFLAEHLWRHVARKHLPGIFFWTLGTLLLLHWLAPTPGAEALLAQQHWALLGIACALGLLPQSGPHLAFVMLYAQGLIPLSVLVASSVVQDGHGLLPLLAYSRVDFVRVKAVNLAAGLSIGTLLTLFGW
jgi:hypothetical protein